MECGGTPRRKDNSILGLALSRSTPRSKNSAPSTSAVTARKLDAADRITTRYAEDVKNVETKRRSTFVPTAQREPVIPCDRATARNVKSDFDRVLKKTGGDMLGWDQQVKQDPIQKQLHFLHHHAKTGRFAENYGPEGRYHGDFLNSMRHGKGEHEFRGEVYDGSWKWDKRDGPGSLLLTDGTQITGDWQAGKPHGTASVVAPDGMMTYEGEFRDGRRHGLGKQIYASGDVYDGGWENGRQHGRGVYHFTNGDKYYGIWKEGRYHGQGVFHYTNGSISRREYSDGIIISVQDFDATCSRFGKSLQRDGLMRHTAEGKFPREVFMLSHV